MNTEGKKKARKEKVNVIDIQMLMLMFGVKTKGEINHQHIRG